MRVKHLQVRKSERAEEVVHSFPRLAWAGDWLPTLDPFYFWPKGHVPPCLPHMVKLHLIILHPRRGSGEPGYYDLARAAVDVLEGRRGCTLDWACGFRASGAVWLLVKPWAAPPGGRGKRVWFYIDEGDLKALRNALDRGRRKGRGR